MDSAKSLDLLSTLWNVKKALALTLNSGAVPLPPSDVCTSRMALE